MEKRVKITDTTLRDAHQSLWATRMRTEEMLPILEKIDNVGYHSLEVWGGATFDVCLRYLNEDPWERLRTLKRYARKTPLQMLLRGQSLVGYQHYPDDVVEQFIAKAVENGIDIIRIFDALNDIRNLEVPIKVAKREGAHVQAAVVYTISPVHTTEHYLETALRLAELGADSICIKDMAGLLSPYGAYDLVSLLKKQTSLPVQVHSHYIGGMAVGVYLKATEAGADIIDTASVPMAFGASQPPVETVVRAFQDSKYDTGLDIHQLFEIAHYFDELRKKNGYERGVTRISDMRVFDHQVPGGMISNLVSQLEEQKSLHRIQEVLEEIPRVRKDLGYPPLVTPTSQIVGAQAVLNVLTGERYKLIPGEVRNYVQGQYGAPPAPINAELATKILGDKEAISCRPADLLEPIMAKLEREIQELTNCREDVISYAIFPQVAKKYFEFRKDTSQNIHSGNISAVPQPKVQKPVAGVTSPSKVVTAQKEDMKVNLKEVKELIKMLDETDISELTLESEGVKVSIRKGSNLFAPANNHPVQTALTPALSHYDREAGKASALAPAATPLRGENIVEITAPMVGTYYATPSPEAGPFVKVGDTITPGQTVCIVEAMKLMNEIESEVAGKIVDVLVENGHPVEYGQILFMVEKH